MSRVRAGYDQERVAIGIAARDRLGGEAAGHARLGLDDDGLAEPLGHLIAQQSGNDVHVPSRRKAVHELDRTRGIILRCGGAGERCDERDADEQFAGHADPIHSR